jgi:iron complex outermembrane recepter protein
MMPSVSTCCARGSVSQFTFIRGVNSAVGYFGEVPTLLNGNALFFDLSNVQVLKGPQGTLFGIATNGGAILYEPTRPTAALEGSGSITLGSNGRNTFEGILNVPVSEKLRLRMGAVKQHMDGYIKNVTTGEWLGEEDYWTARISADWQITDRLKNYSVLNFHSSDRVPEPSLGLPYGPNAGVQPGGLVATIFGGPAFDAWIAQQMSLGRYEIVGTSVPGGTWSKTEQANFVNNTTLELTDHLQLKGILGFVQSESSGVGDTDATPFRILETSLPTDFSGPSRQYSAELQLQGEAFGDALTYVVGSFNRWQKQDEPAVAYSYTLGSRAGTMSFAEGETNSVFAEGTLRLDRVLSGLAFTAGYRHTWDTREAGQNRYTGAGVLASSFAAKGEWSEGSYRWGFTYEVTPGTMVYLTNSKGYTAGGFNLTSPPEFRKYDPESLDNYEAGIKSEWSIGGLQARTNVSVYYGKWEDMQSQVTSRCQTATGVVGCQLTRNAATGEIKGAEAEFTLVPTDSLQLSGSAGYMDGGYTEFFGLDHLLNCCLDLSFTDFLYIPEWKYSLSAMYRLPLDATLGRASVSIDYSWVDKINTLFTTGRRDFYNTNPAFSNLNASLSWRDVLGKAGFDASLFGTNLTQNETLHGQLGTYETIGFYGRNVALPRMWGVRMKYSF